MFFGPDEGGGIPLPSLPSCFSPKYPSHPVSPSNPSPSPSPSPSHTWQKKYHELFVSAGGLGVLKSWLEPYGDGSLPNARVRSAVLRACQVRGERGVGRLGGGRFFGQGVCVLRSALSLSGEGGRGEGGRGSAIFGAGGLTGPLTCLPPCKLCCREGWVPSSFPPSDLAPSLTSPPPTHTQSLPDREDIIKATSPSGPYLSFLPSPPPHSQILPIDTSRI